MDILCGVLLGGSAGVANGFFKRKSVVTLIRQNMHKCGQKVIYGNEGQLLEK